MSVFANICFWLGVTLSVLIVWALMILDSVHNHYAGGLMAAAVPVTIGWLVRGFALGARNSLC